MKWPAQLTLMRHAESSYNLSKKLKEQDSTYKQFRIAYEQDWQSTETKRLAVKVAIKLSKDNGEDSTALTTDGVNHAIKTGQQLSKHIARPDIIYVSPYLRTIQTLEYMQQGWPELGKSEVKIEERIREQDFGLRLLYGDWRVLQVLHPEQRFLNKLQGDYWYRQPQGENIPDVRARNRSWVSSIIRDNGGQNVLAITHHINILAFRANIERADPQQFLQLRRQIVPSNCSLSQYGNQSDQEGNQWLKNKYFNKTIA